MGGLDKDDRNDYQYISRRKVRAYCFTKGYDLLEYDSTVVAKFEAKTT